MNVLIGRASAFMNSWNPEVVKRGYETQFKGYLQRHPNGRSSLNPDPMASIIRKKVMENPSLDPRSEEAAKSAWEEYKPTSGGLEYKEPQMGYVLQCVSEIGDEDTLNELLKHADEYMGMTWEQGGLFYRRNNNVVDDKGNNLYMDPYTGNAAIGYARLNVKYGKRKMWVDPWKKGTKRVLFEGMDLSEGVDVLRATWETELNAAVVTLRTWDGSLVTYMPLSWGRTNRSVKLQFKNLPSGEYGVYLQGELIRETNVTDGTLEVEIPIREETNLVLVHI